MSRNRTSLYIEPTPSIDTNIPDTPLHNEAHRVINNEIERDEQNITEIREEILNHYQIKKDKIVHLPPSSIKAVRDICAFLILKDKTNPTNIYYADGHTAHANLLQLILNKFEKSIGSINRSNLPKDFFTKWEIKKGFIDPYKNGFKKFESINYALKQIIAEQAKNKMAFDESDIVTTKTDKNNNLNLPNWFIASSSRQYKNKE